MNHELIRAIDENPLAAVVDYYARCLPAHTKANAFLRDQRLSAAPELQVGFADRTLGKQIPPTRIKAGKETRQKLQAAGVLKPNGREVFRGRVTVPLTDSSENVTGIYGLRIEKKGEGQAVQSIGTGLFNAMALKTFSELIVCRDIRDAWTFYAAGHRNVLGLGDQSLTKETFANVRRLLIADASIGDDAFADWDLERMRIHLPENFSVHRFAHAWRGDTDALGKRIRAATWIGGVAPQSPATVTSGNTEDTESTETKAATDDTNNTDQAAEANDAREHQQPQPALQQPVASPVPTPIDDLQVESDEVETIIRIETRRWRIRGLDRNTTFGVMKVNVMVFNERTDRFHVDTLDLCHARSRRVFLKECGEEIAVSENELRSDLGRVLLKLEQLQVEARDAPAAEVKTPELSDSERAEAMGLLQDERLLERVLEDFEACGIVGEHAGKLAGYLAATSRLLDKPLGLIIQSSSAAGKSALADAVLAFMPPESRLACSAMTSQSLYYLGKDDLKHKILSVAEEEGVREASYQLKLLQSEGKLSLVSTTKEKGTGRTATQRYNVEGPVALVMTTTALDVDPELMNRCLVIAIDESVCQTAAILQQQRFAETLAGFEQELRAKSIVKRHQNAQRLLRKLPVFNPYAEQLGFVGSQTRHRRDHQKYLGLIKAVTLLHQLQHEIKQVTVHGETIEYLEVTPDDIAKANMVADWALGRSIDELAGPTRRLLVALYDWLRETAKAQKVDPDEVTFTRRQARESLGWAATQLNYHLEQLCRYEYAVRCGGGNGKLIRYGLLYDGRGREGQRSLVGLVDAGSLTEPARSAPTTDDLSG